MGSSASHTFAPVTASKVRLLITNFTSTPSIYEFAVLDDVPATNVALSATATASSVWSSTYAANRANDNDSETRWNSGVGTTSNEWLQLEWPAPVSFNRTVPTNRAQFQIPAGYAVPPGGALLVWADAEPAQNQPGRADLHANFRLAAGQTISLYAADGRLLDAVPLEAQPPDASQGSKPDGDPAILPLSAPTPRVTNKLLRATSATRRTSDGALVVEWSGMPLSAHRIEFSTNLAPASWSLRTNLTADALGNFRYEEPLSATEPRRFLRGVLP